MMIAGASAAAAPSVVLPPRDRWDDARAQLNERLRQQKVLYGDTPVPALPAACMLTAEQWDATAATLQRLLQLIERIVPLALARPELRALWSLDPFEESLLKSGWRDRLAPIARFDLLFCEGEPKVLEINALFSGLAASDAIAEAVLPALDRPGLRHQPLSEFLAHLVSGGGSRRSVALVGRRFDPIISEYRTTAERLMRYGLDVVIAAAEELTLHDGRIDARAIPVDALYVRGTFGDWRDVPEAAAIAKAVLMAPPFASLLVESKRLLALLCDGRCRALMTDNERALIDRVIPRTLPVSEATLPEIAANRERVVLKPADGFGGDGVVFGRNCDADAWLAALAAPRRLVAQEAVQCRPEGELSSYAGRPMYLNTNIVAIGGVCRGAFARVSANPVVNIARSGFLVPVVIEEQP